MVTTGTVTLFDDVGLDSGTVTLEQAELSANPMYWRDYRTLTLSNTIHYNSGGLEPGTYRVLVKGNWNGEEFKNYDEYTDDYSLVPTVTVTVGETITNVNVILNAGRFEGSISGTVTGGGQPLEQINVELKKLDDYRSPLVRTSTDSLGYYQFEGLDSGTYFVRFLDPEQRWFPIYYGGQISYEKANAITVTQSSPVTGVDGTMMLAGQISGLYQTSLGTPIAGGTVWAWPQESSLQSVAFAKTTTATDGSYVLKGLFPGTYKVEFRPSAFSNGTFYGGNRDGSATPITVESGQLVGDINGVLRVYPVYLPVVSR
ncbi:MAG: SdrD B-like domain-containing protein [Caldilineaceae bacterium]